MKTFKSYIYIILATILLQMPLHSDESYNLVKLIKYETSLAYTQATSNAWWSKIEPYNIYLGAIPLNNKNHLEKIKALGVSKVISVLEDFELKDGWLNQPVKKADWEANGIEFEQIPAVDFLPLTNEQFRSGIAYLKQMVDEGRTVYIHCKAGRGRSVSIVTAFLMHELKISMEEAIAMITEMRNQISLNASQRQGISNYFNSEDPEITEELPSYLDQAQTITEEKLGQILEGMLEYAIDGVSGEPDQYVPEYLSGWVPPIKIESTLSRRNRYLREFLGVQEKAVLASINRNHNMLRRFKILASKYIPIIGTPTSYSITLWHQLREISLIAALYGHDVHDVEVKSKILSALVSGNAMKIPAQTLDLVAKMIIKSVIQEIGINSIPGASLPTHLIFNYFTENSAKVSTHAIAIFGGDNILPIEPEEFFKE